MQATRRVVLGLRIGLALALMSMLGATGARAEDKLLAEAVDFTGTFIYLGAKVPGLVIGATRGFGEIAKGSGKEPDGDTLMRVGSITKVFCGATLASMVADGKVSFTDLLQDRLGWDVKILERDGKSIRLIDLATHASGLPREAEGTPGENATSDRSKAGLCRLAHVRRSAVRTGDRRSLLEFRL